MSDNHPDFVTVCKGMGFFASHWSWVVDDYGDGPVGMYQPWQTVSSHYATADEAEAAAKAFASDMGMDFRPWTGCYRNLEEAARYNAIYREEREKHTAWVRELRAQYPDLPAAEFFQTIREKHGYDLCAMSKRAEARYMEEAA